MRIILSVATGAVGQQLLPMLLEDGHEVVSMTRTSSKSDDLLSAGALPVVSYALDRETVLGAVLCA